MDKTLLALLNQQVEKEFYSANLYLSMANWASQRGYPGAAHWLFVQYQEETAHAIHMWEYLLERGQDAVIPAIQQPETDWPDLEQVFSAVLAHEKLVTGLINAIATAAQDARDHAAYQFIQWYVAEQVEEEATASQWLDMLRLAGGQPSALFALDGRLRGRDFSPPFESLGL